MFVMNEPAIVIKDCLIIADLHIGLAKEIYDAGIQIPSQTEKFARKLNALRKKTKAKKLVILGDMKHKVLGLSFLEKREIPQVLSLVEFPHIIIVKGNHDGFIEKAILPEMKPRVSVRK